MSTREDDHDERISELERELEETKQHLEFVANRKRALDESPRQERRTQHYRRGNAPIRVE